MTLDDTKPVNRLQTTPIADPRSINTLLQIAKQKITTVNDTKLGPNSKVNIGGVSVPARKLLENEIEAMMDDIHDGLGSGDSVLRNIFLSQLEDIVSFVSAICTNLKANFEGSNARGAEIGWQFPFFSPYFWGTSKINGGGAAVAWADWQCNFTGAVSGTPLYLMAATLATGAKKSIQEDIGQIILGWATQDVSPIISAVIYHTAQQYAIPHDMKALAHWDNKNQVSVMTHKTRIFMPKDSVAIEVIPQFKAADTMTERVLYPIGACVGRADYLAKTAATDF